MYILCRVFIRLNIYLVIIQIKINLDIEDGLVMILLYQGIRILDAWIGTWTCLELKLIWDLYSQILISN